jgi:hypothetical protein
VDGVIKRIRSGPQSGLATGGGNGKSAAPDEGQRLLVEQWKRSIINEKIAAKQRRVREAASPVQPSSLDEITEVTRIGPLRLLRKLGRK